MYGTDRELAEAAAAKAAEVVIITDADVKAARRAYFKQYYNSHADRIRQYRKAWRAANPDRVAEYRKRHWENVAAKMKREAAANHNGCPECGAETQFSVYELSELLEDPDFDIEDGDLLCAGCANRLLRELHR